MKCGQRRWYNSSKSSLHCSRSQLVLSPQFWGLQQFICYPILTMQWHILIIVGWEQILYMLFPKSHPPSTLFYFRKPNFPQHFLPFLNRPETLPNLLFYCYLIEYPNYDVMVFCHSIVMVPNKWSLHQASDKGLQPACCIVNNRCDHRSSGSQKLSRTSFYATTVWLRRHTSVPWIRTYWALPQSRHCPSKTY